LAQVRAAVAAAQAPREAVAAGVLREFQEQVAVAPARLLFVEFSGCKLLVKAHNMQQIFLLLQTLVSFCLKLYQT